MSVEINQKKELQSKLWKMANTLRGNMDANEFKDYILGLLFYRYVSECEEMKLFYDANCFEQYNKNPEKIEYYAKKKLCLGYFIKPEYLFSSLVKNINNGSFDLDTLKNQR